jgi:hypothetical protein
LAATGIAGALLLVPSAAYAQTYGGGSEVPPQVQVSPAQVSAPASETSQGGGATLPFTGGDIASLTLIAAAALGTGVVLARSGRSRATA